MMNDYRTLLAAVIVIAVILAAGVLSKFGLIDNSTAKTAIDVGLGLIGGSGAAATFGRRSS